MDWLTNPNIGVVSRNRRKFRHSNFNPATSASRSIILRVALEGVVPVQQDMPPGRRRHLRDLRQRPGVVACFVLRQQPRQDRGLSSNWTENRG